MFSEYHSVTIIQRITKKNFIFWKLTENNFLIAVCVYCATRGMGILGKKIMAPTESVAGHDNALGLWD